MKKLILFLFICLGAVSQTKPVLQNFESLCGRLKIKNDSCVFVKVGETNFILKNKQSFFKFNVVSGTNEIINFVVLDKNEASIAAENLKSLRKIDHKKLNVFVNENGLELKVDDGSWYQIKIIAKNSKTDYELYAPEEYITQKFANYQEKEIVLKTFRALNQFFYDSDFQKVIDAYYIGISFKKLKNNNISMISKKENFKNSHTLFDGNHNICSFFSVEKNIKFKNNQKIAFVDLDFFKKYKFENLQNLFSQKKMFLVQKVNAIDLNKNYLELYLKLKNGDTSLN